MRARAVLPLFRGLLSAQCYKSAFRSYRKLPRLEDLPDAQLLPLIALVGRPNVGKSALFNRLVRKRDALVYDTPSDHVTRDYREGLAQLGDLQFRVIDTSGLEPAAPPTSLQGRAAALTRGVLQSSHGVIMMLDARQGVVPADEELLQWLRRIRLPAPVMLLANKADTAAGRNNLDQIQADLAALGVADSATPISATSGDGLTDLYQLLQPVVDAAVEQQQQQQQQAGSSSSSMRHYVPAAYRFSAAPAAAAAGLDQTAVAAVAAAGQQKQQEEEGPAAELSAAAADSDEAEVDRFLQQHANHAAAAAATDSDSEESEYLKSAHTLQPDHIPSKVSDPGAAAGAAAVAAAEADSVDIDDDLDTDEGNQQRSPGPLRLAILGLPNAGKSTLMNTLLGYERSLTGPEPGLTRDPTFGWLQHAGNDIQLVDTAGWKRPTAPAPVQDPTAAAAGVGRAKPTSAAAAAAASNSSSSSMSKVLADASLSQAKRALSAVHVVVLLLDAPRLLTIKQAITRLELQIATLALDNGKALIIALNKSDAVPGGRAAAAALRDQVADMLDARFVAAGRLPVVSLSALEGSGTDELMNAVVDAYAKWNKRVSSYKLRASLAKHSLRFYGTGGTSHLLQRIKWAVQVKSRPPTFAVLLRGSDEIDEQGKRFISNVLRQSVGLEGVPLRLYVRYNKRQKQQQPVKPRWHRRRARQ